MDLSELQAEYEAFKLNTENSYFMIKMLYDKIENDKSYASICKKSQDVYVLKFLLNDMEKLINHIHNAEIDFKKDSECTEEMVDKDNLLILPLYKDKDIYVNINDNIRDIFDS